MPGGSGIGKNTIIFGVDNSSSAHGDNSRKDSIIPDKVLSSHQWRSI